MNVLIVSAISLFALTLNALPLVAQPISGYDSFWGGYRIQIEWDSPWQHCDLMVFAINEKGGKARWKCDSRRDRERTNWAERHLEIEEVEQIRTLLREADLYFGQYWGSDPRNADIAIVKISFWEEGRTGTIIISGNKTFEQGARSKLREILDELRNELHRQSNAANQEN